MKYRLLAVAAATSVSFAMPALAQFPAKGGPTGTNGYSVEGQLSSYRYEEPDLMDLKGIRGSVAARVTHDASNAVFTAGEAKISYGRLDYSSVGTGKMNDVPDHYYELRALVGKRFHAGGVPWSPYFGFGWRHLVNNMEDMTTTTGHFGYKRVSDYYYLPIGIEWRLPLGNSRYLESSAEYDLLLRGTQKSYLPGETIKNTQNRGHGIRATSMYGMGQWAFGPYVNYWKIAESTVEFGPFFCSLGCVEPKNETLEAGLRLRYTLK